MNVIKKLRRKFILISTATVTIIVIGALSLVTSVAYIRINAQIDSFLIYISQNNGRISEHKLPPNTTWFSETDWTGDTPDFPYQIRYFSVLVDDQNYIKEINIKIFVLLKGVTIVPVVNIVINIIIKLKDMDILKLVHVLIKMKLL